MIINTNTDKLNELCKDFNKIDVRRQIINEYKDSDMFTGSNESGELVELHISSDGLIVRTYQNNGWVRVNYYDNNGEMTDSVYESRWK